MSVGSPITATLPGFSTVVREDVIVAVGRNVELPLSLNIASVAETITVSGESPVIDTRSTRTATNFTSDELNQIPTSRDPFALMRSVPGVLVDRVNSRAGSAATSTTTRWNRITCATSCAPSA